MKILWNNCMAAFAMFSKLPVPPVDWTEDHIRYILCFFPWVGVVIGLVTWFLDQAARFFSYSPFFLTILLVMVPVAVTGGIHIDGMMDTADARASWQDREERLRILKDPHAGVFAVIRCCTFFLAETGAFYQMIMTGKGLRVMCLVYVVSRCLSGLGVILLPKAGTGGTVEQFALKAETGRVKTVLGLSLLAAAAGMLWLEPVGGLFALAACGLTFLWYRHFALKYFGGTSGDLSGCFLCTCEMTAAVVLALCSVIPL